MALWLFLCIAAFLATSTTLILLTRPKDPRKVYRAAYARYSRLRTSTLQLMKTKYGAAIIYNRRPPMSITHYSALLHALSDRNDRV